MDYLIWLYTLYESIHGKLSQYRPKPITLTLLIRLEMLLN